MEPTHPPLNSPHQGGGQDAQNTAPLPVPSTGVTTRTADPLVIATEAVSEAIVRNRGNPAKLLTDLAAIKAAYIQDKFGVRVD